MKEIKQEKVNIHCEYFAHELLREAAICETQAHKMWEEAVGIGFPTCTAARTLYSSVEHCRELAKFFRELAKFFSSLPDREAIDKFFESWDYGPYQQVENDIVYRLKWRWHEAKRLGAKGDEPVIAKDGKKAWVSIRTKTGKKFYNPVVVWRDSIPLCQEIYGLGFSDRMEWRELTLFDTSNILIAQLAGTGNLWLKKKL